MLSSVIVVIFVIIISFIILYLSLEKVPQQIAVEYSGNGSFYHIFSTYIYNLLTGHWGYVTGILTYNDQPLYRVIGDLLPYTLQLIVLSLVLSMLISIPLGSYAGMRKNSMGDIAVRVYSLAFYGIPVIFTSYWFLLLFSSGGILGTNLPVSGPYTIGLSGPPKFMKFGVTYPTHLPLIDGLINGDFTFSLSVLEHIILPATVLALWTSAALARFMRNEMIEHLSEAYVTSARARGLSQRTVMRRYVRRNSLIPFVTEVGPLFAGLIGWVVIIENIFGYPGIGFLMVQSVLFYYFNGLAVCLFILGLTLVVLNFISDLIYAFLDPRLRY